MKIATVLRTCKICGGQYSSRGILNHERACAARQAVADTTPTPPAEPPEPANPELTPPNPENAQPDTIEQPRITPSPIPARLDPVPAPVQTEEKRDTVETMDEIETLSGDTIKIIRDVAKTPIVEQIAPSIPYELQATENIKSILQTPGVPELIQAGANLAEAITDRIINGPKNKRSAAEDDPNPLADLSLEEAKRRF
ncbi:hypothetical protein MsAg5_10280 [Methanosarcinaceae archaeon Ag5]|uniref:Uncharacterized protein n=2 Tax=Methanolapillus africanus TaxID=3028297 RepID=A0AAE4MK84_9EURY|nr:hypothetical protein [Methanosarcinaceae archaeon Ag5]